MNNTEQQVKDAQAYEAALTKIENRIDSHKESIKLLKKEAKELAANMRETIRDGAGEAE